MAQATRLRDLDAFELRLGDAERQQRNFLLTGEASYRQRYLQARADVLDGVDRLVAAWSAEGQDESAQAVEVATKARIERLDQGLALYDQGGLPAALAIPRKGEGQARMREVAERIGELEVAARKTMDQRIEQVQRVRARAERSSVAAATFVVGLLGFGAWVLSRERRGRSAALQELGESRDLLERVLRVAPVFVYVTDGDGTCRMARGAGLARLSLGPSDLVGQNLVTRPETTVVFRTLLRRALAGEELHERAVPARGAIYEAHMVPVVHDGHVTQLLGISIDVTEREHADRALRDLSAELDARVRAATAAAETSLRNAEALTRDFAALSYSMSHDLRTPLRAINGYTRMLEEDLGELLPERARADIARVHANVKRMAALIDGLIELAKIARSDPRLVSVDLERIAREAAATVAARYPGHHPELEVHAAERCSGDPALLRAAVEHIVDNAFKFTRGVERPRVRVDVERIGDELVIRVRDNGVGFDPAYAAKLFAPFERLHGPEYSGLGLGLALAERIARKHGGRMWAESAPGGGTTVGLALPYAPAPIEPVEVLRLGSEPGAEKFRLLADTVTDYAIFLLDPEGRVESWSRGAQLIKGWSAAEIVGQPFTRFYPPEDVAAGKPARELAIARQQGRFHEEGWRVRKDGSRFWASVTITALRDATGQVTGFGKVTRDLSARRRAEEELHTVAQDLQTRTRELEVANREVEALSAAVSQALRASLRAVSSSVDDLAGVEDRGGAVEGALERVRAALRGAEARVEALPRLARVSIEDVQFVDTDLASLAREVADRLRAAEPDRVVELVLPERLPARADPRLARIVVENLLANAWKFTRGRDRARVEVGERPDGGAPAFFVRDDGVGFDMAKASRLFEPFARLHEDEAYEGAGLGLTVVKQAVERMGGRVWADATPGAGATFWFTLGGAEPRPVAGEAARVPEPV